MESLGNILFWLNIMKIRIIIAGFKPFFSFLCKEEEEGFSNSGRLGLNQNHVSNYMIMILIHSADFIHISFWCSDLLILIKWCWHKPFIKIFHWSLYCQGIKFHPWELVFAGGDLVAMQHYPGSSGSQKTDRAQVSFLCNGISDEKIVHYNQY